MYKPCTVTKKVSTHSSVCTEVICAMREWAEPQSLELRPSCRLFSVLSAAGGKLQSTEVVKIMFPLHLLRYFYEQSSL